MLRTRPSSSCGMMATGVVYPHRYLRLRCQCANCVDEMSGRPRLDPDQVPQNVQAVDHMQVGNYGPAVSVERYPLYRHLYLQVFAFGMHLYGLQHRPRRNGNRHGADLSRISFDMVGAIRESPLQHRLIQQKDFYPAVWLVRYYGTGEALGWGAVVWAR